MSIFFTCNDKIYKEGTSVITPDNRSLRYGDGLFETIKTINGKMQLRDYHFERLFAGMDLLQFEIPRYFTVEYLEDKIAELCKKNQHNNFARVRLMIFRGDGGLYDADNFPNYIIQTWSIEQANELNSNGLIIDVYQDTKKHCDKFANIKSNNFLPYIMAALHAKQLKVNDCIVLNNFDRIADTTIANIFIIKDNITYTPPLTEGCVAGVARRLIIEKFSSKFKIIEKQLSIEELQNGDEVFLTNSIKGIRWVKQFRNTMYSNCQIKLIHDFLNATST